MKIIKNQSKSLKNQRESMHVIENPWKSLKINGNHQKSKKFIINQWKSLENNADHQKSKRINEQQWNWLKINEDHWKSMKIIKQITNIIKTLWKWPTFNEHWKSMDPCLLYCNSVRREAWLTSTWWAYTSKSIHPCAYISNWQLTPLTKYTD